MAFIYAPESYKYKCHLDLWNNIHSKTAVM